MKLTPLTTFSVRMPPFGPEEFRTVAEIKALAGVIHDQIVEITSGMKPLGYIPVEFFFLEFENRDDVWQFGIVLSKDSKPWKQKFPKVRVADKLTEGIIGVMTKYISEKLPGVAHPEYSLKQ